MILRKTYKFKLYRNRRNRYLSNQIDIAGIIYNHCIALHRRYYRMFGRSLDAYALMKHITKLKRMPKYAFWRLLGSQAIQDIVQRIDKGYKLFFRNLRHGIKTSPPGFRKVKKYRSFTLKQTGWKLLGGGRVRLGRQSYRYHNSGEIEGEIKTVTVKRNPNGELFVCFSVMQTLPDIKVTSGRMAGFDFGLKTFLTCSDGTVIESPLFFREAAAEMRQANRKLSRKQKGSSNFRSARYSLQSLHETIADKRRDWFFKLAHALTDRYDILFFETLNLKAMHRLWGRKVSDLAFAEFLKILEHVAVQKGKTLHMIERFYPSSKTCHGCGHVKDSLELSERRWRCGNCGRENDRDLNAALNILSEGASSLGRGDVRREPVPAITA